MNAPVLPDDPADECLLGRDDIATDLAARIVDCKHCQVFGVYGDWGSGKTSFLRHVRTKLESSTTPDKKKQKPSAVLWFEAWRCSADEKPVVSLLHEIRRALAWNEGLGSKVKDAALKAARHGANVLLGALTTRIGMKPGDFSDPHSEPLPAEVIREQLESAVATLIEAHGCPRLVIIIDDLDRCRADAAMQLLEGIKIYLNLKNCVFLLGLNAREVQRAVEKFLPGTDEADHRSHRAAEYLEKICTYPVRLPYFRPDVQAGLVSTWFTPFFGKDTATALAKIVADHKCLPPNPRKMKVWANSVLLLAARKSPVLTKIGSSAAHLAAKATALKEIEHRASDLALVASLYAFHPEHHRRLQRDPFLITEYITWAREPIGDSETAMRKDHELRAPLATLESTHRPISADFTLEQFDSARRAVDPSLPNIFYCQRLLVSLNPTAEYLAPWLNL